VTRAVLSASWGALRRASLLVPVAGAGLLVLTSTPVLDDGYGMTVLRGVGVLLACAWVVSTDDPMGEVLAAAPYSRAVRWGARMLAAMAVVVPTWTAAALVVEQRASYVPVLAVGLEGVGLCAVGLAVGAGLRAWRGHLMPSYLAVVGVIVAAFVSDALPRAWRLNQDQFWGPPWEAAHIRWAAVLLFGVAIMALALRDPLEGRSARTLRNRRVTPG
jgi:hypothetical protein